ncbi:MAG: helix-turn-helix transcriptional regulator [Pseudomonadota bacterium]|nr:helix-turn-helix transcriptional regulator [Pseudomonadota bacterium]
MNSSHPIGRQLAQARSAQSLAIHDIEAILKIKPAVIEMLESDQYPSQNIDVFLKGQLISYCKLLNINPQTIINCLEAKGYDFPLGQQTPKEAPKAKQKSFKLAAALPIISIIMVYIAFTGSDSPEKAQHQFTQPIKIEQHYDN